MWQWVEILNLFKKLEWRFLVESTKFENASLPLKSAISEANVKTNWMVTTKWIYHKEGSFASKYFIFLKFCFNLRTSYKESIWCTNDPNTHIRTFCKRWSLILGCSFPVSILKSFIIIIIYNFIPPHLVPYKTPTWYFPRGISHHRLSVCKNNILVIQPR